MPAAVNSGARPDWVMSYQTAMFAPSTSFEIGAPVAAASTTMRAVASGRPDVRGSAPEWTAGERA
jgi:hypothetical protein